MSLFSQFKMDTSKEQNGVWVQPAGANADKTVPRFLLARMGPMNKKYQRVLERTTSPYKRQIQLNDPSFNDKADELMQEVFANSILLSWENVQDEKNQLIIFNIENAIQLFKIMPDLYYELLTNAQNAALYRLEEVEIIGKN